MAASNDSVSMALFCDFENVALGVRDAQYEKFDIRPVLERLLAKGSIVVKKAYCDWERYKGFKSAMHEANFELIEIPHVRQSGKNSADIRMVVDALDLCYTKAHVDTFVIISGDSDFSPLVSKLRENAKRVIGVGVKQSCSDLLVTNCDEFIYYDDLVRDRDSGRGGQRREREKRSPEEEAKRSEKQEERKGKAVDIVSATFADLIADRGESERIWASVLKEVVKRRNPGFNENYYGFRSFGNLLEEAANRGLLGFGRDDKGAYVFRAPARPAPVDGEAGGPDGSSETVENVELAATLAGESETPAGGGRRRGTRRSRNGKERPLAEKSGEVPGAVEGDAGEAAPESAVVEIPAVEPLVPAETPTEKPRRRGGRRTRQDSPESTSASVVGEAAPVAVVEPQERALAAEPVASEAGPDEKSAKKPRRRTTRNSPSAADAAAVADADAGEAKVAKVAKAAKAAKPRKPRSRKAASGGEKA